MDNKSIADEILHAFGGCIENDLAHIVESEEEEVEINVIHHSPYYSLETVPQVLKSSDNTFTILSLNVQSINAKFSQLEILLAQLSDNNITIDSICIQETWLAPCDDLHDRISPFNLEGFDLFAQGYSTTSHGGLFTYLNKKYQGSVVKQVSNSTIFEGLFIKATSETLTEDLIIGNIYRPPHDNNNRDNVDAFVSELDPILEQLNKTNSGVLLAGDYNINLLQIKQKDHFGNFFDSMLNNSFYPKITLPTRFAKYSCSLLDNIFCKLTPKISESKAGILLTNISDHLMTFLQVNFKTKREKRPPKLVKQKLNTKKANDAFIDDLTRQKIYDKLDHSLESDPNHNYSILESIIEKSRELHFPDKLVKYNKRRHKDKKWITYGIINSINKRDRMYRELKCLPHNDMRYPILKHNLSIFNVIIKKSIKEAKAMYYRKLFDQYKHDIKKTWMSISEVLNRSHRQRNPINSILINDNTVTDKTQIVKEFNEFFANIGPILASKIDTQHKKPYTSYLKTTISSRFYFTPVEQKDVDKAIKSLKPKTSYGHDHISTKSLKSLAPILLGSLTLIVNQSLITGIFPKKLKVAKVMPLHKKGDLFLMDNYRPVSLLTALSKVFEKVAHIQLYDYFKVNKLFYTNQYGFRDDHSTELATLELIDRVNEDLDNKKYPIAIYMDLSKAFDTLDHNIMLFKLQYYGVSGSALSWFQSYLTERYQYVEIDGVKSDLLPLTTGVPQGSILGPLLFLIYMNDIPNCSSLFKFILFADDTSLIDTLNLSVSSHDKAVIDQLNNELSKIYDWLAVNKLSLNVSKTKYMIFHYKNKEIPDDITISINGIIVERVCTFNFLGVTIHENLSWKPHVEKVVNKVSKNIGILNRLKNYLPQYVLRIIYCSLIQSQLIYAILIWGFACGRLEKLQKKAIRIISGSRYNAHTEPLFKSLRLLKMNDLFQMNLLKFYYRLSHGTLPPYFNTFNLMNQSEIHSHNTRNSHRIAPNRTRTQIAQFSVRNRLPSVVNNTDTSILSKVFTHSSGGFNNYVKNAIIDSYSSECNIINCFVCSK